MERNTLTTIDKLNVGDRFYKVKDKNKTVWEKVAHEIKQTNYQTYSQFATKGKDPHTYAFRKDAQVIFLRSKNFSEEYA